MPNRIVREGLTDSEAVATLPDFPFRVFSLLLLKVDDAGRIDGRPGFIRSMLFPVGTERTVDDIASVLLVLESAGLLMKYTVNGKPYVQLAKWQRCGNATTSKFPDRSGSHRISYVKRETRDGEKDFVTSSIFAQQMGSEPIIEPKPTQKSVDIPPDPIGTPSDPNRIDFNTKTETKSDTKTCVGDARAHTPDVEARNLANRYQYLSTALMGQREWKRLEEMVAKRGVSETEALLNRARQHTPDGLIDYAYGIFNNSNKVYVEQPRNTSAPKKGVYNNG